MRAPAEACARGVNSEKWPNAPRRVNSAILCTIDSNGGRGVDRGNKV